MIRGRLWCQNYGDRDGVVDGRCQICVDGEGGRGRKEGLASRIERRALYRFTSWLDLDHHHPDARFWVCSDRPLRYRLWGDA